MTVRADGDVIVYCFACEAPALRSLDAGLGWSARGFPDGQRWQKRRRQRDDEYDLGPPIRPPGKPLGMAPPAPAPTPEPVKKAAGPDFAAMFDLGRGAKQAAGWNWFDDDKDASPVYAEAQASAGTEAARIYAAMQAGDDALADALVDAVAAAEPDEAPAPPVVVDDAPPPPPPAPKPSPRPQRRGYWAVP